MKNKLIILIKCIYEIFASFLFPFSLLLGLLSYFFPFEKINLNLTREKPIIIFEHWLNKNYWHIFMKRYLESKGYRVYWLNCSLFWGGAEAGAEKLSEYLQANDIRDAVLVGISYGAISAYSYLERQNGWGRVNKFIAIAGPFKGTPLAILLSFLSGGRQILPKSEYLEGLVKTAVENKNKIVTISAKFDEMVPRSSSTFPGAQNIVVETIGHNMLHMFSKEVFKIIAQEAKI